MLNLITPVEWFLVSEKMPPIGQIVLVEISPAVPNRLWIGQLITFDVWQLAADVHRDVLAWAHLPMTPAEILAAPAVNPLLPKPSCSNCGHPRGGSAVHLCVPT